MMFDVDATETSREVVDAQLSEEQAYLDDKGNLINLACGQGNIPKLIELASTSGGLLDEQLRATAWSLLLGCSDSAEGSDTTESWHELPVSSEEEQVKKDVDRAATYGRSDLSITELELERRQLQELISRILRANPTLHYGQGYHDIAQIFLLVFGPQKAFLPLQRMSLTRLRDYMQISLALAEKQYYAIPVIIQAIDPELAKHLRYLYLYYEPSAYATSAATTLFAHDVDQLDDICRLFDFLLTQDPVIVFYFFAALIVGRRKQILEIDLEDADILLMTLSRLTRDMDIQHTIDHTLKLFNNVPPSSLPTQFWSSISKTSILQYNSAQLRQQTLAEARKLHRIQAQELAWRLKLVATKQYLYYRKVKLQRTLSQNRRPILTIGGGALALLLALWLGKSSTGKLAILTLYRAGQRVLAGD